MRRLGGCTGRSHADLGEAEALWRRLLMTPPDLVMVMVMVRTGTPPPPHDCRGLLSSHRSAPSEIGCCDVVLSGAVWGQAWVRDSLPTPDAEAVRVCVYGWRAACRRAVPLLRGGTVW